MADFTISGTYARLEMSDLDDGGDFSVCHSARVQPVSHAAGWQAFYGVSLDGGTSVSQSGTYTHGTTSGSLVAGTYLSRVRKTKSTQTVEATVRLYERASSARDWERTAERTRTVTVPPLSRYRVTFDASGGTGAPAALEKWHGEGVALARETPTRDGYEFNSWNTSPDGGGTAYAPGSTYSDDASATLHAVWNPRISFDANGGIGAPAAVTKTHGEAATIPNGTPTKPGYRFVAWNTRMSGEGESYQPGGTIPSAMNSALTLYARWDMVTRAPTIQSVTAVRCDDSGRADDAGTHAKITVWWSVDTYRDPSNTGTVSGRYRASDSDSYTAFAFPAGSSGGGGTATKVVPGMDTDTQYEFTVTVTDSNREAGHTCATTRTAILTRAKFLMDFRAGGGAIGIGSAAPESGLMVGFDATFTGDVSVSGNVSAANLALVTDTGADVVDPNTTPAVSAVGYRFGQVRTFSAEFETTRDAYAGQRVVLGVMRPEYQSVARIGFADANGTGYQKGGVVYYTPSDDMTAGTSVQVSMTFIRPWVP